MPSPTYSTAAVGASPQPEPFRRDTFTLADHKNVMCIHLQTAQDGVRQRRCFLFSDAQSLAPTACRFDETVARLVELGTKEPLQCAWRDEKD